MLVHSTSHRAPSAQRTLLLAPTVTSHSARSHVTFELCAVVTRQLWLPSHSTLQLFSQASSQRPFSPQSRLQLGPHDVAHDAPSRHAQLEPEQVQSGPGQDEYVLPHAATTEPRARAKAIRVERGITD